MDILQQQLWDFESLQSIRSSPSCHCYPSASEEKLNCPSESNQPQEARNPWHKSRPMDLCPLY